MINRFYERNEVPTYNTDNFFVREDRLGRPMLYINNGDKEYTLTFYKSGNPDEIVRFLSFDTLQRKYGVRFVRDVLGVDDFQPSTTRIKQGRKAFTALLQSGKNLDTDVSSQQETIELLETANNAETSVKTLETSFIEVRTQTDMTKREMDGIIKAMTTVKEEIANELAKLNETNKDLAKENTKLEQAKSDNDEFQIERISSRIRDLESERSARLEVINVNKINYVVR